MTSDVHPDDFDVAKKIVSEVKDLTPERRERVFRWVAESLGLSSIPRSESFVPVLPAVSVVDPYRVPSALPTSGRDIKTFMTSKAPKGDAQFATAVAYYYRFEAPTEQQKQAINGTTLQEATRLTGRPRLNDPRNTLNNAKKSGYLDNSSPGEFSINTVGENLVAMTLPGTEPSTKRATVRKSQAKAKKKR